VDPMPDASGAPDPIDRPVVIALDGPSGTGKSTVARGVARVLGYRYLDTGAMYRAATLAVLNEAPDLATTLELGSAPIGPVRERVTAIVASAKIDMGTSPDEAWTRLGGDDVSTAIRTPQVTKAVSAVSAVSEVRSVLVAAQRAVIERGPIVVEGRDIATVVWPAAQVQVYLTASADARAARRAGELGRPADVAAVQNDLVQRDTHDSTRADSPLSVAAGAVTLDTSDLSVDEVIQRLVDMARKAPAHE
jgi:cytidylate kinase